MIEVWRNIEGFLGYQVSSEGRVRSFWKRKHRSYGYGCDWVLRRENIQKAYRDGMCDERIRKSQKAVIVFDLWTGKEFYFNIKEAASELNLDRSSISHVLIGDFEKTSHYTFEYAGREEKLLYGSEEYECYQRISGI